jgi:hypothetical protein
VADAKRKGVASFVFLRFFLRHAIITIAKARTALGSNAAAAKGAASIVSSNRSALGGLADGLEVEVLVASSA